MKKENNVMSSYAQFIEKTDFLMKSICDEELEKIEEVSQMFAKCIAEGGLVHMYGSGHSRMGVEEMFPRYGSYPGYHPMVELSTSFYDGVIGCNGIYQSMYIENISGLATRIVKNNDIRPNDCFMFFTTSGTGNVVVEMAEEVRAMGCKVVGVISAATSEVGVSKHAKGLKLADVSDVILDNHAPVGDACVFVEGLESPVGALSTLGNSMIVNLIKVRVAELLTKMGQPPKVITHASYVGKEKSAEMFDECLADFTRRIRRPWTK